MPLRNERQAYWDDIENHIARVQPLTASQALDRVCPDAAAERLALKSRLRDVEEQTRQVHRLRARAAAEAGVLAREADAALDLESKERAFEEARRFVRGRLQNDRPDGQRLGMRAPERLARAALGAPREDRLRAAAPFAVASPAVCADAHRERNERWGSGEVSPLMGGGYTVVLQRAAAEREDAAERREKAERERALYFMESGGVRRDPSETRVETSDSFCHANDTMNRTSAAMALRGWEPAGKRAGRERARRATTTTTTTTTRASCRFRAIRKTSRSTRDVFQTIAGRPVSVRSATYHTVTPRSGCRSATRVASGGGP